MVVRETEEFAVLHNTLPIRLPRRRIPHILGLFPLGRKQLVLQPERWRKSKLSTVLRNEQRFSVVCERRGRYLRYALIGASPMLAAPGTFHDDCFGEKGAGTQFMLSIDVTCVSYGYSVTLSMSQSTPATWGLGDYVLDFRWSVSTAVTWFHLPSPWRRRSEPADNVDQGWRSSPLARASPAPHSRLAVHGTVRALSGHLHLHTHIQSFKPHPRCSSPPILCVRSVQVLEASVLSALWCRGRWCGGVWCRGRWCGGVWCLVCAMRRLRLPAQCAARASALRSATLVHIASTHGTHGTAAFEGDSQLRSCTDLSQPVCLAPSARSQSCL